MRPSAAASRAEKKIQNVLATARTVEWTWFSAASLEPSYSQPMDDAMVELAGRCF